MKMFSILNKYILWIIHLFNWNIQVKKAHFSEFFHFSFYINYLYTIKLYLRNFWNPILRFSILEPEFIQLRKTFLKSQHQVHKDCYHLNFYIYILLNFYKSITKQFEVFYHYYFLISKNTIFINAIYSLIIIFWCEYLYLKL